MTDRQLEPAVATVALESAGGAPLLVLAAVEFEARRLARRLCLAPPSPGSPAVVRTIGLGAATLPARAPELLALAPAAVLAVGLCGGCAPDLRPGDVVAGDPVGPTAAGDWLRPPPALAARVTRALEAAGVRHRTGRLLTLSRLAATPADKARHWRADGAIAVDMESARVLDWARRAGVPAMALRAVADGPDDGLPPALLQAIGREGGLRPAVVLGWVARPGLLTAAWGLRRRSHVALDGLSCALAAFISIRP